MVHRPWCEALAGQRFGSDIAAARYVLRHGAGAWTTHPLICVDQLPRGVVKDLAGGSARMLMRHLKRSRRTGTLGPLVDLGTLPGTPEERETAGGGGLGLFLADAGPDTPLPDHPSLTLGTVCAELTATAARVHHQLSLTGSRTTEVWDAEAEEQWCARWDGFAPEESDDPLVSVVMPVRDRAGVVEAAVASVLAQTLPSWELVVVDDGSVDATPDVLRRLAAEDPRIRVVTRPAQGVCAARNRGLREATGRYLAFLDSDNTWRPDFLRLAVAAMTDQGLTAAYAAMALRERDPIDGSPAVRYRAFAAGRDHLMAYNHVDLNVLVVERELALATGGFDEKLRRWVDHDFVLRVSEQVEPVLLPFIAVDYDDTRDDRELGRITTTESEAWQFVVLGQHWVDWTAVGEQVRHRVAGRVSVVIPTWNDATMTIRAVEALVQNTPADTDLEIVVVDNGSRAEVSMHLAAVALLHEPVRIVRLPRNLNFAIGCNVGFAHSTGDVVVMLNNDTEVKPGWLPPLVSALDDPEVLGAQPLLLYPDGLVQTAGTAFPVRGSLPTHFLAGHPVEDALGPQDRRFRVVTAAALAVRAADLAALHGFDPMFVNGMEDVDLCLRAAERRPGHFAVVPESQVTHHEGRTPGRSRHITENRTEFYARWNGRLPGPEAWRWEDLGFRIAHVRGDAVSVPAPRVVLERPTSSGGTGPAPLRWGLRNPAPGGQGGDLWGDTHFLDSLAAALRRQGQEVVSFRHGTFSEPATAFDDVVLGVRGLDVVPPVPGKVNVLWIISHPDAVSPDELVAFDLVYAASESWAAMLSARTGRPVHTLLQATDGTRLTDLAGPLGDGSRPVFVGGAQRPRQIVRDALDAGVPLQVHGPGWAGKIPDAARGMRYLPNDRLAQTYRSSGLVLADHWPDMARTGFLANRLFDAVAAGARVVSDPVPGLEIFEGAVQAYRSPQDLAELCSPAGRERFPDDDTMRRIAQRVADGHTFDHRAATLVADVRRAREHHETSERLHSVIDTVG